MFTDKTLTCADCKESFVFTAGEQQFFHSKQFKNDPKHCKSCKQKRSGGNQDRRRPLTETQVICSDCGAATTVPFKPLNGKPVLCRGCFQKARA